MDILAKTAGGLVIGIIVLLLLLQLVIRIPAVQNALKNASVATLQDQLYSDVKIGKFRLGFPKKLVVSDILISKSKSDTLIYLGEFSVNIKLWPLLKNQIVAQHIVLRKGKGNISRLLDQISPETPQSEIQEETGNKSSEWEFFVNKLNIESCYFTYRDEEDVGFELILDIGKTELQIGMLNLDTLISCEHLDIENTFVSFEILDKPEIFVEEDTSAFEFADIHAKEVLLLNVEFAFIDSASAILFNAKGEQVDANDLLVDITHEKVAIDEGFAIKTTTAVLFLPKTDTTPSNNESLNWGQSLWRVEGNEMKLDDYRLTIDYQGEPNPQGHFNNEHLNVYDVNGKLSHFILDYDTLIVDIQNFSGKESNGFEILQMNADMKQGNGDFIIRDMQMKTPVSDYSVNLVTTVSPTNFMNFTDKQFNLELAIKSENWNDLEYFTQIFEGYDFLADDFSENNFEISTILKGSTSDLTVDHFDFKLLDSTLLMVKGNIRELINMDSMSIDLDIKKFMTSKKNVVRSINTALLDSAFSLPEYLVANGQFNRSTDKLVLSGTIESDIGKINIDQADIISGNIPEYYIDLNVNLDNLTRIHDVGINRVILDLTADFQGEDLNGANGHIALTIDSLEYQDYDYHTVEIIGEVANGEFGANIESLDSNLHFKLTTNGEIKESKKDIYLDLTVENADLHALNLHNDAFKLKGDAVFAVTFSAENNYTLESSIRNLDLYFADTIYKMHPIDLSFLTNAEKTDLDLNSYFYQLTFNAKDHVLGLTETFSDLLTHYFSDASQDSIIPEIPDFQINGYLNYQHEFAHLLSPDIPSFKHLSIDGSYSKYDDALNFNVIVPGVQYQSLYSDSLKIRLTGTASEIDLEALAFIEVSDILNGKMNLSGHSCDSGFISNIRYSDAFSDQFLNLSSLISVNDSSIYVRLLPDRLIFNYDPWEIDRNNQIEIGSSLVAFDHFNLSSDNQQISIVSFPEINPQNIELNIQGFSLSNLEPLLNLDTLVNGRVAAKMTIESLFDTPAVDGFLHIDSLRIQGFDVGQLTLTGSLQENNILQTDLQINGPFENIQMTGNIDYGKETLPVDLDIDLQRFDIDNLNYLLSDYISEAKGSLKGKMNIHGDLKNPNVNGEMNFSDAALKINSLQEYFTLGNETLLIKNNVIEFNEFSINNRQNQAARILGSISFNSESRGYTDLLVKTDNMEIMNSRSEDNDLVYGLLKAQADIKIQRTPMKRNLDLKVKVDKSTRITYIFPDDLAIHKSEGVVRYQTYSPDSIVNRNVPKPNALQNLSSFDQFKSNIDIEKGARFTLLFDESGHDFLDATLSGTVNYTNINDNDQISGMFAIGNGKLHYGIPLVTVEDYSIEPGSFLTITNDLYNPYLNIIASSSVRASTEGLMADYNKVMTFKVLLYMVGELNNLKLRFDVSTETSDVLVSARLANLSAEERNMNALNLLARGAFIISVEGTEAGGTSIANAQIDKFYANQLNHLISENIHFVDLHFDVQSFSDYNSSGDQIFRRNYYYNVGKSFFHDRAKISYKGSLGISSELEAEQVNSSFVQNELNVEVNLSKDGTYKGVVFRKNQYEGLLEGEVIETGGGIRFNKNYYSLKDLFTNDKKQQRKNQNQKKD